MREFFNEEGHKLDTVFNGREGLASALRGGYDLMILDVMLPGIDGFSVLEQLRTKKNLPVIMLTARVQQKDRIHGLNSGADDYLPKPFNPRELLARIRAVLRRAGTATPVAERARHLAFSGWRIDCLLRELKDPNGTRITLTGA